ncbi:MAG: sugar phosphate nucleotidyltransferase [Paracoccaceae bacterium]|nr:sugar phosphate nucleotidyltransferase [Paracoccaceae bacterium]MDG1737034.1 sugar phosphate nucleotidyltransferase [Paracoccaceae bacterium]MDG2258370.1 sugar phosphate nucleotidyltransferase [Paracoccaceae bacterium]
MDNQTLPTLLVLAGGFGTRLQTVVADVPKPLAPVSGKPFLYYQLNNWYDQGARDIVLSLHFKSGLIKGFISDEKQSGSWPDCNITCLTEQNPLGTGGAIAFAVKELRLTNPFITINADTWVGTGLSEVCSGDSPAISVVKVNDAGRYGLVKVHRNTVQSFEEKTSDRSAGSINAGIYFLSPELFGGWQGEAYSLETDVFPELASQGILSFVQLDTEFLDIGVPDDYIHFCNWIEKEKGFAL